MGSTSTTPCRVDAAAEIRRRDHDRGMGYEVAILSLGLIRRSLLAGPLGVGADGDTARLRRP